MNMFEVLLATVAAFIGFKAARSKLAARAAGKAQSMLDAAGSAFLTPQEEVAKTPKRA